MGESDALVRVVFLQGVLGYACASGGEICRAMRVNSSWAETLVLYLPEVWQKGISHNEMMRMLTRRKIEVIQRCIANENADFYALIWASIAIDQKLTAYLVKHRFKDSELKANFSETMVNRRADPNYRWYIPHPILKANLETLKALVDAGCKLENYIENIGLLYTGEPSFVPIAELLLSQGVANSDRVLKSAIKTENFPLLKVVSWREMLSGEWEYFALAEKCENPEILRYLVNKVGIRQVHYECQLAKGVVNKCAYIVHLLYRKDIQTVIFLLAGKPPKEIVNAVFCKDLRKPQLSVKDKLPAYYLQRLADLEGVRDEIGDRMQSSSFRQLMYDVFGQVAYEEHVL